MSTIKEIAKACNVSIATVSNILNNKPGASKATRDFVLKKAKELNYTPNYVAKNLKSKNTRTIGVIAEDMTIFSIPDIIDGITRHCEEENYQILLMNLRLYQKYYDTYYHKNDYYGRVHNVIEDLIAKQVNGIIYVAAHERTIKCIPDNLPIPAVMAYGYTDNGKIPSIVVDDVHGAYEIVNHMIEKGHQRIGVITGKNDSMHMQDRLTGYQKALYDKQILYDPSIVCYGDWIRESGYEFTDALLDKGVTAVFCMNDRLVKDVIIPYQWEILNDKVPDTVKSYCIHNFRIAAGEIEGEFYGAVFQDTDVAKWLEAVAYTLEVCPDKKLEALADKTIKLIERAQSDDGYLNTYFTIKEPKVRWQNLMEGHELYTAGHMIEAAVAYYKATGKRRFLDVVIRLADAIDEQFGPEEGKCHGYPGHQEIELALVKLYHTTKEKRYLELARYFIDVRGKGENYFLQEERRSSFKHIFPEFRDYDPAYSQSHLPVLEQAEAVGHSVRAVYMYCAMADLAYETRDEALMNACVRLWDNMVSRRMYITGGIGSSGILERFTTDYDLPNDENYSETCASIGLAQLGKRMAKITKDASYVDVVERALYNTVLSGIAIDGKSFFYVNPLEVWPDNCMPHTSKEHVKPSRQKWFPVACCPPNISRTLASLGQYLYFQEKNKLYVNLFVSNEAKVTLNQSEFNLELKTKFPFENKIELNIKACESKKAAVYVRVPGYARNYHVLINGKLYEEMRIEKGYAVIEKVFHEDKLVIKFESPAEYVRANPKVRADSGKTAIIKGPLVYCLEEIDNGGNLASIYADTRQKLVESYDEEMLDGVLVVSGKGKRLKSTGWAGNELYKTMKPVLEDIIFKAIPYCFWCNRQPGEMAVWLKELL